MTKSHAFQEENLLEQSSRAFTYRLLRSASKNHDDPEKLNITVSCEMAAPSQPLHCFLEYDQTYLKILKIFDKEPRFSIRKFIGTNLIKQNYTNSYFCWKHLKIAKMCGII